MSPASRSRAPETPPPGPRRRAPALALSAALLGVLASLNALDNPFVYDDYRTVLTNPTLRDPGNFLALLLWERFRPLVNVTYAFDYALWELEPRGYHLTSLALHAVCVVLFFVAARAIFCDRRRLLERRGEAAGKPEPLWLAFAAAALFAVHPLQSEAVGYVSGRSEVLCGIFFLAAFLGLRSFLVRGGAGRLTAGLLCFVLALGSKEVGAMLPFVLAIYDFLLLGGPAAERRRRFLRFHLPFLALISTAGIVRLSMFFGTEMTRLERPVWQNVMTEWEVVWRYLGLLVLPRGQTIAHPVVPAASPADAGAWLAGVALVLLVAAAWALRRREPLLALGIAWFLLLLAPSSTVIPLQELMAEHRVYAASGGFFLALVAVASRLLAGRGRGARRAAAAALAAGLVALAAATTTRHRVWSDPVVLWREAAEKKPLSWWAAYGLGEALANAGRFAEAVPIYRRAVELRPLHLGTRMNLGISLAQIERYDEARQAFQGALDIDPRHVGALNNLGRLSYLTGRPGLAEEYFARVLEVDPRHVRARLNLIEVYRQLGRPREEIRALCEEVAAIDPEAPGIADCLRRP